MDTSPRSNCLGVRFPFLTGSIALALVAFALPSGAQQTGTIVGQVVDAATERPLPGAQVSVPGTGIGVLAGAQGRYTLLNVPAGEVTVRAQVIGYATLQQTAVVRAGETATLDFLLGVSALALDELVVTGVGQATARRELSTSVSVLGAEEIAAAPVQTLDQLLQGRVAGASVNAVSAQPGTASLMNFRGVSSVFGAQTPVIYVDGVRVDNAMATAAGTGGEQSSALAELLTSDIERIEITRGGAASTLFGSDAATGVIQIFTRRGTPGPARITARIEQGVDVPELKYILDAGLIYPDLVEAGQVPANFVEREFFRNAHTQSYSLGVTGGTDAVTYSVSGRIEQADGVQPKNEHEVFNLRGGIQAQLSDRTRLSFSGGYTRTNFGRIFNGTAFPDPITALEVGDVFFLSGADDLPTALEIFLNHDITESVNRFQFSTGVQYDHSSHLTARATVGVDHRNNQQRIFEPIGFIPGGRPEGALERRNREFTSVTLEAAGTYSYPTEGPVTSRFTAGIQGFRDNQSIVHALGRGFALPGSKDFSEAADITAFENNQELFTGGFFFDEQIGLWNRVFVNAGIRFDGGTSFGDDVTLKAYPKAGAVWALGQEDFVQDRLEGIVGDFQLRVAYGETGKLPPPFLRDRTLEAVPFRGESAPRFANPGNPDLKPEVTQTFEAGFEASFLSNRVGLDFTWFDARTKDALFFVPEPPVTGLGTQIRNVGAIKNTGVELTVDVLAVNRRNVSWNVGATLHTVRNRVTDMGGVADFNVFASGGSNQRVTLGRPVGAWWVTTPVDTNEDGLLDDSELEFTGGSPLPTRNGSFSTRITLWESLQLTALADWAGGHEVFDWGSVWATFNVIYRRELVEDDFQFPIRHSLDGQTIGTFGQSAARSAFIMKGDWLKLREITARYDLPRQWTDALGASRATVFGSVRNVAIWSSNPMVDPELAGISLGGPNLGGITSITVSPPRSFRIGVEVGF